MRAIDHVNLVQPWQTAEEAVLFLTSVFGLAAGAPTEVAAPPGLVRSRVMRTVDGAVRLPLNVAPHVLDESGMPQHIAFACTDVVELARTARVPGAGIPSGTGQLLRLRGGPIRRGPGDNRRTPRIRPAVRPESRRRIRALLHPHSRQGLPRVRRAARALRRIRKRQRPGASGRSTGRPRQLRR